MVEQRFVDYWQQRRHQEEAQIKLAKQQAWDQAQRATTLLKQEFGATRILVFGSLVKNRFSLESDIDMAVAGVAKDRFFEAVAAVNGGCDRWIDLKPIESLEPYFWQRIQSQGIWMDENTESGESTGASSGH